ncbi:permease [Aurantimicrobium sp. INA4]|uniref:DMT family transporter n=1 Tax=Aurantimicrobium sp. INA4 TaxID=2986279 RepID=UPI002490595A|nr:EamA family transporter [Aurantimicrobium sp. INA4]BDU10750.1 permease [Aurantimicrobium sp. INA4]
MKTTPHASYGGGVVALLLACTFWGTTGMAASFIPQINPVIIGASTMGIGGLILGLTALPGVWLVWHNIGAKSLVIAGAFGLALYSTVFYIGMSWAGVALGNVIALGSAPLFAGLIEWVVDKQRPTAMWLVATAIAVVGGVLLVSGRNFGEDGRGVVRDSAMVVAGIVLALLAGFAYALYTYMANKLMKPHADRPQGLGHRPVISTIQLASALPLLVILIALVIGNPGQFANVPLAIPVMAYLAIFPTAVGHLLLAVGLGAMPASRAAVYTLFEPVVAVILAVIVVGEVITPLGWIGLLIVLAGLALLSQEKRSR